MARSRTKLNQTTEDIIKDLIKAKPTGPGNVVLSWIQGKQYTRRWSRKHPDGVKYVDVCTTPNFGYTDEQIFSLGIRSEDDAAKYLRLGRDPNTVKRADYLATRRQAKLLWMRIYDTVTKMMKDGGRGIYSLDTWSGPVAYFFANDPVEAQNLAHSMLIQVFRTEYQVPGIKFHERGDIDNLSKKNAEVIMKIEGDMRDLRKQIEEYQHRLDKLQLQQETLNLLQSQQYAIEGIKRFENI